MRKAVCALLLVLAGCRPEPGESDYANQGGFSHNPDGGTEPTSDVLPGPFPFEAGKKRLGVGFYEGGRSDDVPVDNTTSHIYLYEGTVTIEPSDTHIEGRSADLLVHAGKTWLGLGVHWDTPHNLDAWKTLHVSLRSSDPGFANVSIGMNDTESIQLPAKDYGYVNDGEWHHVAIPLTAFTAKGLNLAAVQSPFVLIAGQGAPADKLVLDNLYFTAD